MRLTIVESLAGGNQLFFGARISVSITRVGAMLQKLLVFNRCQALEEHFVQSPTVITKKSGLIDPQTWKDP